MKKEEEEEKEIQGMELLWKLILLGIETLVRMLVLGFCWKIIV